VQVGEGQQSSEVDIFAFGSVTLNAYTFRSRKVACSIELLQDSNFPLGAIIERVFAMRHARGVGQAMIKGSGVSAPTGLITAALANAAPIVIATGSSSNDGSSTTGANSIGTNDLWSVLKKLDPMYRTGAVWAMTANTLNAISTLLDKQGRPLVDLVLGHWQATQPEERYYLLGHRVVVCPSMNEIGAAANEIILYQPRYFIQRRVPSSMYVRRYAEAGGLVENGLIAFENFYRVDSNLVAPNSAFVPAVILQAHS